MNLLAQGLIQLSGSLQSEFATHRRLREGDVYPASRGTIWRAAEVMRATMPFHDKKTAAAFSVALETFSRSLYPFFTPTLASLSFMACTVFSDFHKRSYDWATGSARQDTFGGAYPTKIQGAQSCGNRSGRLTWTGKTGFTQGFFSSNIKKKYIYIYIGVCVCARMCFSSHSSWRDGLSF